jgi:hypothetical protein
MSVGGSNRRNRSRAITGPRPSFSPQVASKLQPGDQRARAVSIPEFTAASKTKVPTRIRSASFSASMPQNFEAGVDTEMLAELTLIGTSQTPLSGSEESSVLRPEPRPPPSNVSKADVITLLDSGIGAADIPQSLSDMIDPNYEKDVSVGVEPSPQDVIIDLQALFSSFIETQESHPSPDFEADFAALKSTIKEQLSTLDGPALLKGVKKTFEEAVDASAMKHVLRADPNRERTMTKLKEKYSFGKRFGEKSKQIKQAKSIQNEFKVRAASIRGSKLPRVITNTFQTELGEAKETITHIPPKFGTGYLRSKDSEAYGSDLEERGKLADGGIRPSENKKPQASILMNGREHTLEVGGQTVTESRSGAFAVHGAKTPGLEKLKQWQERLALAKKDPSTCPPDMRDKVLLAQKKAVIIRAFLKENGIENLDAYVEKRKDLVVSQGLDKIGASLLRTLSNPKDLTMALATGEFLHREQSYLSNYDASERPLIDDMKAAMDEMADKVVIKFGKAGDEPSTALVDGKIVMTLPGPTEEVKAKLDPALLEKLGGTLNLETSFSTMGVNEMQTLKTGIGKRDVQNQYNQEALARLRSHAGKALKAAKYLTTAEVSGITRALGAAEAHFAKSTEERGFKDTEGIDLLDALTRELGGTMGRVCKSGKDRTSMAVIHALASSIKLGVGQFTSFVSQAKSAMFRGASHELTNENTWKGRAYAFNAFQRKFLPSFLRPPASTTGEVES